MIELINIFYRYFERPYLLLLIIPALILLFYFIRRDIVKVYATKEYETKRKKLRMLVLISRILVFLFLVIALASPFVETSKTVKGDPKIKILVDNSTSMDLFDLAFTNSLKTELENRLPVEMYFIGNGEESRLGDGILINMRKDDNILLLTDGNNNQGMELGDVSLQATNINTTLNGIVLFTNKFDASVSVLGSSKTTSNVENTYSVVIKKTENRTVHVVVDVDGSVIIDKVTSEDQISFDKAFQNGYHKITAKISGEDYFDKNNIFYKTVKVVPKPKVLLVTKQPELEQLFSPLYELNTVNALPSNYDPYTAIIIDDIPAEELDDYTDELASYISEGNGMFVAGGRNSYDFGNYNNSRFEQLVPAFVARAGRQKGEINIVFVIDISKSTGEEFGDYKKVDVEKALAIGMLNNISLIHNVGFLAFNTVPYTLADIKPLLEQTDLQSKVISLKFSGGTNIAVGLLAAVDMLQDIGGSKNIILISDGRNNLGPDPVIDVVKFASSLGIRIYPVGVGGDTNAELMQQIADLSYSTYFQPETSQQIKLIFGDTEVSVDKKIFFLNILDENHFITHGLNLDAKLYGFNQVVPKDSSKMLISTDVGDPIVVVWRFGLGRVATLASDVRTFGFELLNRDNSALLTKIANWVIGDLERKNPRFIDISDGRIGGSLEITIKSETQPSSEEVALYKIDENLYKGTIVANTTGFSKVMDSVFAVNYKREYQDIGFNNEIYDAVASTGGKMFYADNTNEIVEFVKQRSRREILTKNSYSWIFLAGALVIFLIEVIVRRLTLYKIL